MKISSFLTSKILAKRLGITETTLLSWRSLGLPTVRIRKSIFIFEDSFLKWAKRRENAQDASGDESDKSK